MLGWKIVLRCILRGQIDQHPFARCLDESQPNFLFEPENRTFYAPWQSSGPR
jgi:hypothetical protein